MTDNPYGSFSLSGALWRIVNEIIIPAGSSQATLYYNSRITGTHNIQVTASRFSTSNTVSLKSKNKFDIVSANGGTFVVGQKSSLIRANIIDPRNTLSSKAKGTFFYSGSIQPSDGDIIKIHATLFEFDSNNSITAGNIQIAIADTADNTYIKLKDKINEKVNSVNATIDITTHRLYIEAKDP